MKKLIALFLLICMLFGCFSCAKTPDNSDPSTDLSGNPSDDGKNESATVIVPEYKDYGKGSINFNEIVYSRPAMQAILDSFESVTVLVDTNEVELIEQISAIKALEEPLENIRTMYSMAEIYKSKDSTVEFWQSEYAYISSNYPRLTQAIEELLVACAKSAHRSTFESDYFGYSLEKYLEGSIYTDEVVALMVAEAALEAEYSSLSTATVEISYKRTGTDILWEGTVEEVIKIAREYFKNDDKKYKEVLVLINDLYEIKLAELQKPIYISLLKTRRLIADELGYRSYAELAYKTQEYDYSPDEMKELLKSIGKYVSPVASDLDYIVFRNYFNNNPQPTLDEIELINKLYALYASLGGDYQDAYSYMLQHGLYDVSKNADNRFSGAFTTYVEGNNSPYIFMSASGFIRDYSTLSHEFGHFLDFYVNNGESAALSISEVSSQALELLTLLKLKGHIKSVQYEYLEYYTLYSFLNSALLSQSFYAMFEHLAYELDYDEITEDRLAQLVEDAFHAIYGDDLDIEGKISYVIMPHTVLYPFYVESYAVSGLVSLDVFFAESQRTGKSGDGFAMYEALINRGNSDVPFLSTLETAGIDSPFKDGKVREIANNLYFHMLGKTYYKTSNYQPDAA